SLQASTTEPRRSRSDDVPVAVLQIGRILVRDVADPLAVVRPHAPKYGERVACERGVVGAIRADLPEIELPGAVRRFGKSVVRADGEPSVVGAELQRVLFRGRVVRELLDLPRLDLDLVQVVLLVASGVLSESDEAVVAAPSEPSAHRS